MKSSTKILFVLGCACTMTAASASAQLYTFDENGNSSGPSSAPPISPGVMQADPSGALTVPVLVYNLALPVITGDVVLLEPGNPATGGQYSDVLRFWNPTGGNVTQIIFYSDVSAADPADALADTGLPQLINPVFINEVGSEGANGALYTPGPADPGSVPGAVGLQYNIISDVPEPNILALAALGSGLLLVTLQRRQIRI